MKKKCEFCAGSGQVNFFQGASRFLLTVDECPHCAGTGLQLEDSEPSPTDKTKKTKKQKDTNKSS